MAQSRGHPAEAAPIELQVITETAGTGALARPDRDGITLKAFDLSLLCFFVLISDLSYSGLTALVVAYEKALHFDLTTTGWVASAEGAGYTAGAFLAALLSRRVRVTRVRVAVVFGVLAAAQFLSIMATGALSLAACRCVSGIAAGLAYAAGIATIARSTNSDRAFALYFGANFASGLFALIVIPPLLQSSGLKDFYACYGVALIASAVLTRWFPLPFPTLEGGAVVSAVYNRQPAGTAPLVVSIFINFVFNGGLWVLAEHFGLQIPGTDPTSLSALLAGTMLFGLLGTVLTALVARRWSHLILIHIGNAGLIASVLIMAIWHSVAGLTVSMALLNISVTCLTPAILAALSVSSAQGPQWGNLAAQSGYSAGSPVVAMLSGQSGVGGLVWISVSAFALSSCLAWLGVRIQRDQDRDVQ